MCNKEEVSAHAPSLLGVLFLILSLTLCMQQGRKAHKGGFKLAETRLDVQQGGGAGTGTLTPWCFVFDSKSNSAPAARHDRSERGFTLAERRVDLQQGGGAGTGTLTPCSLIIDS